jgi:hypothetical protein
MAPRPHNSGHYTLDACATDQFQQQVRALCGLPLGDPRLLSPVVMVNLLGDVWHPSRWGSCLRHPGVQLHLYGKAEARAGPQDGALQLPGGPGLVGRILQSQHNDLAFMVECTDTHRQPMPRWRQPDIKAALTAATAL